MLSRIREVLSGINISIPMMNIPRVGPAEIVDILIVSFIVYFVMKWIRQTRAWSLLKGIFIILVIWAAAWIFNLITVLWVMENALTMGLVVVVILFQPELRNALEQIGRGKFLSLTSKGEGKTRISVHTVNEVIKAVTEMSFARTGALIVMEREVPLGEHEQTGIALDASVSSQLLINIFKDKTPLHDGAVIIKNNRITAATCILPLTSVEIGSKYGTRHRAAVGISEVSDALVIVVSEETGLISIAEEGQFIKNRSENQLREKLLASSEGEKNGIIKSVRSQIKKGSGKSNA